MQQVLRRGRRPPCAFRLDIPQRRESACRPDEACFFPVYPPRREGGVAHLPPRTLHSAPPCSRATHFSGISTKNAVVM